LNLEKNPAFRLTIKLKPRTFLLRGFKNAQSRSTKHKISESFGRMQRNSKRKCPHQACGNSPSQSEGEA
jgi:hypothetical protein